MIRLNADKQIATLIKCVNGVHQIIKKPYQECTVRELKGQNTAILNDMLDGKIMSRDRARKYHYCEKMPTRISDIRSALELKGLFVDEIKIKTPRNKIVKNYYLNEETIRELNNG